MSCCTLWETGSEALEPMAKPLPPGEYWLRAAKAEARLASFPSFACVGSIPTGDVAYSLKAVLLWTQRPHWEQSRPFFILVQNF